MARVLLPLLLFFSLANAELITVECSDGKAQFERVDLLESKCLRITQSILKEPFAISNFPLKKIDSKSLRIFIKLSKLNEAKKFAFIDSLSPDAFQIFDFYAKYLGVYHEFDALFKYKFLKEYGLNGGDEQLYKFVSNKYTSFEYDTISLKWGQIALSNKYVDRNFRSEFNSNNDHRVFLVLIDFYQKTMQRPLKLSTVFLKNVFDNFDRTIQNSLIQQNLVVL